MGDKKLPQSEGFGFIYTLPPHPLIGNSNSSPKKGWPVTDAWAFWKELTPRKQDPGRRCLGPGRRYRGHTPFYSAGLSPDTP